MTQPDPAVEIVASVIANRICGEEGAWDVPPVAAGGWVRWRAKFRDDAAAVLAALRDAGWRPRDEIQDLAKKLEAVTAEANGNVIEALFEQRDEAITERDRLRPVVEAARLWREMVGNSSAYTGYVAGLIAAVDAYDAQPKATGGVIKPGTFILGDDSPSAMVVYEPADELKRQAQAWLVEREEQLRAEGYEQAITHLRDDDAFVTWMAAQPDGTLYDNENQLAADYLSARLTEGTTRDGR